MTNEIAKPALPARKSAFYSLAAKLETDPAKLLPMLKKTVFAACRSDEEFMAMCLVANTYNLNPILKEIYAFPSKGGSVVPIVGVDGWTKMMNTNPAFDGIEFDEAEDGSRCTAIIYRKDRNHPIKVTEWLDECKGTTAPWMKWPRRMLRHKAMIQAARVAFGYGGIYEDDEALRIEEAQLATSAISTTEHGKATRRRRASASEILQADAEPAALPPTAPQDAQTAEDGATPATESDGAPTATPEAENGQAEAEPTIDGDADWFN